MFFVVAQIVSGSNMRVPIRVFPTGKYNVSIVQKFWIQTFESLFTSRIGVVYYLKADARC